MSISRRNFASLLAAASLTTLGSMPAAAQAWPARPVKIIVGFPAGGVSDLVARLIAGKLSERLGQAFVVENRLGASTNIATEHVARSAPDGYTLLHATNLNCINASTFDRLPFNFINDFVPIGTAVDAAFLLEVHPSVPVKTVPEFIAHAKAHPGKLTMASSGTAGFEHLAGELFKLQTGLDLLHVPYKGSAPAVNDLVGGHVHVYFGPIAPSIEHIKAERLRAIAVTTAGRSSALPDIPPIGDFLSGYAASAWQGLAAPKGTPVPVVEMLNAAINAALKDDGLRKKFLDLGATPLPGSPSDFATLIARETAKWASVVKTTGIRAE